MQLLDTFAHYAAAESRRELPPEVMHHAKRVVIDWFSALYPGVDIAPATLMRNAHQDELGHGRSSLPGAGTTAFPALAAWINGSASHAVEMDDIFRDAIYHPGCPVIAAALAVAEDRDASGADFLRAVVIGYEISTRIGAAVQPAHYRFFHTTGTVGVFGAAAAAAALLAPGNAQVSLNAMATAASFASGLQQAFRSDAMTKALHAGNAANVGVRAAQAAALGVTGVADILEGEVGFGAALASKPSWAGVTDGLGTHYNVGLMTQKAHACCGHTFAAIDMALALRDAHALTPDRIERIEVETYQVALDVTGNFAPTTAFECKFSLPYVVAHALCHGAVRLNAFDDDRMQDSAIRALMQRLDLRADAKLSAAFPTKRSALVRITTTDGRRFEQFTPYRQGDPEAPLSDAQIDAKFIELAAPVLGAPACDRLLGQLWRLDALNVRELQLDPARA